VYICIPSLAALEWHAFTIAASSSGTATLLVQVNGDWTAALYQLVGSPCELPVRVEGPYEESTSAKMDEFLGDRAAAVFLVAGGSGITALLPSIQDQVAAAAADAAGRDGRFERMGLLWCTRELEVRGMNQWSVKLRSIQVCCSLAAHKPVSIPRCKYGNNGNSFTLNIIIIIPREGVGGALGATARKPSLPIPIWRMPSAQPRRI
jgi:hypothetical protein